MSLDTINARREYRYHARAVYIADFLNRIQKFDFDVDSIKRELLLDLMFYRRFS